MSWSYGQTILFKKISLLFDVFCREKPKSESLVPSRQPDFEGMMRPGHDQSTNFGLAGAGRISVAPNSGRAKLPLCLGRSAGNRTNPKNRLARFVETFGRRGSDALPMEIERLVRLPRTLSRAWQSNVHFARLFRNTGVTSFCSIWSNVWRFRMSSTEPFLEIITSAASGKEL